MYKYLLLLLVCTFLYAEDGCTDETACNYNPNATIDDGSCVDVDPITWCCSDGAGPNGEEADCNGNCAGLADYDDCGVCSWGMTGNPPNLDMDCSGICFGTTVEDECGVCDGDGGDEECWDGSYECDPNDCPFNPNDCTIGTTYMEDYLSYENICVPSLFSTTNTSNLQAYYFFQTVTINEITQVSIEDWVGAFNGAICVGVQKWDTSLCGNEVCSINIMGDNGTDLTDGYMMPDNIPSFKIYVASENIYYDAVPSNEILWANMGENMIDNLNAETNLSNIETKHLCSDNYHISNIYPNPFNPITNIEYSLPENSNIELIVYNIHGRQIQALVKGFQTAGYHSINWNAQNFPSGLYLIRLESSKFYQTQTVVLIK